MNLAGLLFEKDFRGGVNDGCAAHNNGLHTLAIVTSL
jgi:hypothetical protein